MTRKAPKKKTAKKSTAKKVVSTPAKGDIGVSAKEEKESIELTDKQQIFCEEYLKDFNATQAAIRAGYSEKTASEQASRLLTFVKVQDFLAAKKKALTTKLEISQERTLLEIGRVAFQDARTFFDDQGQLIPIHQLSDDAAAALAGFEVEEKESMGETIATIKKIKRHDKTKALEMLAKHYNIYSDAPKNENNINLGAFSQKDLNNLLALKKKAGNG